ncbi:MAG TPA: glycine cleavage system protein GcvH [Mycobacteriales bacterium]|nr:glycine cleavage system protein GcvH [Mycobacteriales bacterium]
MHVVPEDLSYTAEHEWARREDDGTIRVGITDFAQEQLGDIVFVSLPTVGTTVAAGGVLGEVESTKSVSEIYAPLAGEVVARNEDLDGRPELINSDTYGGGWLVVIRPANPADVDELLDAAGYQTLVDTAS